MTKMKIIKIANSIILSGIIILMIGIYYFLVKAGIPYQDPSTEMEIRYAVNSGIGEELIRTGIVLVILGEQQDSCPDYSNKKREFKIMDSRLTEI